MSGPHHIDVDLLKSKEPNLSYADAIRTDSNATGQQTGGTAPTAPNSIAGNWCLRERHLISGG
ncbi:hypothetical protein CCR75_006957 [Bremia lactucae]|uniref:Uncharacterized protein n=1 Tax=Bremia lactucae TaxID=4779 RepID=A0A976NZI1_BRELC|nr:hypothetical protein CCR75_006957 [Bremia lactucae]